MRRRSRFVGALYRLFVCLFIGVFIESTQHGLVPPGNVYSIGDVVAAAVVLFGAWWAGCRYYEPLGFLIYGLLGGMGVGVVFLPDRRDYIGMSMGLASPISFICSYCTYVLVLGFACRALGRRARATNEWRDEANPAVCQSCGYLLYGLPENRCPECGNVFESPRQKPPSRLCPSCVHDLSSNTSGVCPECGTSVAPLAKEANAEMR